ncbi:MULTISPECIES: DUF2490 domain-containing protein [Sphingobium]|uniref:DUF2490 domain-containing protein n=1 Tax=Sphingobium tyrosinilyticum TaxID=2715436 RepID=A0ABV9F4H0_9SPHN|nr:DUF2490 domain-containing protein [Sphingobium sp. EP60837]
MIGFLLAPGSVKAATAEDEQVWMNLTAMGAVTGDLIYFTEVQPRIGNGVSRIDQTILRGAVGWKFSRSLSVYQGYAHVVLPTQAGRDVNEERSFQQVNWTIGKPWQGELSSRTRLEQRWRSDGGGIGWRLREMLRYEKPLKPAGEAINALAYAEGFAALNNTGWGQKAGFDQLRSFVGAEIKLMGKSTTEIGYLNQYIDQGSAKRMNHVASITLFFRH